MADLLLLLLMLLQVKIKLKRVVYAVTCVSLKIMSHDRLRSLFQFRSIGISKCADADIVAVVSICFALYCIVVKEFRYKGAARSSFSEI